MQAVIDAWPEGVRKALETFQNRLTSDWRSGDEKDLRRHMFYYALPFGENRRVNYWYALFEKPSSTTFEQHTKTPQCDVTKYVEPFDLKFTHTLTRYERPWKAIIESPALLEDFTIVEDRPDRTIITLHSMKQHSTTEAKRLMWNNVKGDELRTIVTSAPTHSFQRGRARKPLSLTDAFSCVAHEWAAWVAIPADRPLQLPEFRITSASAYPENFLLMNTYTLACAKQSASKRQRR